ncbi:hypothetical protein Poly30_23350 [Planctomycetes bacterium Poly30]|uniref:Uncharacterized protein n=1 Tax=Saltatorellus ferox TaxID=2528018 RepID=A0A518ERV1_9BACT|nr:hypothetical protein Poly30_23350 [Planctomycetes bacterium Poly30]
MDFLRKNWLWIVIPILFVIIAAVLVYKLTDDPGSEFVYPV